MPFNSKSSSEAVKKTKKGPVKKERLYFKEKMKLLYEKDYELCSLK